MRVFRGRLVHCKVPEKVEILEDYLIGFEEKEHGKVLHNDDVTYCNQYCKLNDPSIRFSLSEVHHT